MGQGLKEEEDKTIVCIFVRIEFLNNTDLQ